MTNNPESIEREIAHAKRNLGRQLSEAEGKAREAIDWKTHYRRNPLPMLAAAAAAGVVISSIVGGRSSDDPDTRPRAAALLAGNTSVQTAMEKMVDALVAAASAKAAEYIEEWLPGFHQEFSRRQS